MDFYYTEDDLSIMFAGGGIIITMPFAEGIHELTYEDEVLGSYFAGPDGVNMSVNDGINYSHGYHKWHADTGFVVGTGGVIRYRSVCKFGHLTAYHMQPIAADVHRDQGLESIMIDRAPSHEKLVRTGENMWGIVKSDGEREYLDQGVINTIANQLMTDPDNCASYRKLVELRASKGEIDHPLEHWKAIGGEVAARGMAMALHESRLNLRPWKSWLVRYLLSFVGLLTYSARNTFAWGVYSGPIQPIDEGHYGTIALDKLNALFENPRPPPNGPSSNSTRPTAIDGGPRGDGKCESKSPEPRDVSVRAKGTPKKSACGVPPSNTERPQDPNRPTPPADVPRSDGGVAGKVQPKPAKHVPPSTAPKPPVEGEDKGVHKGGVDRKKGTKEHLSDAPPVDSKAWAVAAHLRTNSGKKSVPRKRTDNRTKGPPLVGAADWPPLVRD
jgi:hypothetical protein